MVVLSIFRYFIRIIILTRLIIQKSSKLKLFWLKTKVNRYYITHWVKILFHFTYTLHAANLAKKKNYNNI